MIVKKEKYMVNGVVIFRKAEILDTMVDVKFKLHNHRPGCGSLHSLGMWTTQSS